MNKRKYNQIDNSNKFQIIINSISSSQLYMPEFYKFLYKQNHNISEKNLEQHMNNVSIYNTKRDYINEKNKTNTSIYYNKGHWYCIVNNKIYESYKTKLQTPYTNGFCQSYALYLAANNGNINNDFKEFDYVKNIQIMASLHIKFINSIHKQHHSIYNKDFVETFNDINISEYTNLQPVSLNKLKSYLQDMCNDYNVAHDFAVSH